MRRQSSWTTTEIKLLKTLIDREVKSHEIGVQMGRSNASVKSKATQMGWSLRYNRVEPQDKDPDEMALASNKLRDAINGLIDRMPPNDVAMVLGKAHLCIPGAENFIRGQMAERRLAA